MKRIGFVALVFAALWSPVGVIAAQTPALPKGIPAGSVPAKVMGAEDGEKLVVELDGEPEFVRFLGADAPEPDNDGNPECYFEESRDYLSRMLKGRTVYLEQETSDKDGKDRLLRYVWFVGKSDGKAHMAQEEMLREGYLIFKAEEKDDRYEDRLRDAEKDAKADDAGLWGECGGGHVAVTPTPEPPLAKPAPYEVVEREHQAVTRPRQVWRITTAGDLSPEVAGATLAAAARAALDSDPDALVAIVFAYRDGDDSNSVYTVGVAEVSRDGKGHTGNGTFSVGLGGDDDGDVFVSVVIDLIEGVVDGEPFASPDEEVVMRFPRDDD